jgi:hypothetical protein
MTPIDFLCWVAIGVASMLWAAAFLDDLIGQIKLGEIEGRGSFGPGGRR